MSRIPLLTDDMRLFQLPDNAFGSVLLDMELAAYRRYRYRLPLDNIVRHRLKQRVAAIPIKGRITHGLRDMQRLFHTRFVIV